MSEIITVGLYLAKNVFRAHGADAFLCMPGGGAGGGIVFRGLVVRIRPHSNLDCFSKRIN